MNKKKLNELNRIFEMGFVPQELSFTTETFLDWSKLQYTNLYDNPAYIISKLPPQFMNLPGSDEIVKQMIKDMKRCKLEKQDKWTVDLQLEE